MSLTPTSKSNPCQICEDTAGKCRQGREDQDYWQCMTYADSRKGEIVGGFKCIGHTRDRLWAQFRLDNSQEWSEQQRQDWQQENQRRRNEQASENEQRQRRSLSVLQRHEQYTRLLSELTLHPDDRADLVRRGFTHEQIELAGFRSIGRYQQLQSQYSELLPGISRGKRLIIADQGYLCPIRNVDGLVTACQVRLRSLPTAETNRYRWLSGGGQTLHLYPEGCKPEGELPLAVFRPHKPEGIALVEGTGAKPFLVSQRLNLFTIGAAGGQWASSPELFRETLEKAAIEVSGKIIKVFPDAGDTLNKSVMSRWQRVITLLEEWGWEVAIGWWGQIDKTHPDIDELTDHSKIEFIKPEKLGRQRSNTTNQESLLSLLNPPLTASFPIQPLRDGICKVLPIPESVASCWTTEQKATRKKRRWFESVLKRIKKVLLKPDKQPRLGFNCFKEDNPGFEEKIRQVQRKLRSLSYDADIESHQRYLPNELATQLPKSGLIGIKAPKGCGKSVLLKKIIAIAKKQGIPVLSITPRIALGREQAIKWEITWIDDYGTMQTRAGDTAQQIEEVAKKRSEARGKLTELESIKHQQLNLLGETEALKLEQQKTDLRIEIERCGQEIENINAASIKTLALCWDSLWRTKDRDLKESLIIIDEAELGFKHFITGSTCKRNRPYLLQTFKDKLSECLMSGGRVILSDADLTDLPINYVREILPIPIKPFIVTNEYIGEETRWIVDFRTGSRGNTLRDIVDAVGDGTYLAITTDSQAEAQALEKLILQDFPDEFCAFLDADGNITEDAQARKKALIVRIDRTTTESEAGKKFIQKPNEQILHWQPRVLIYTPSMGVGVSIDESTQRWDADWEEMVPYFDAVYGLFFGVIEPSQCRQQLSRVRANVPRIVYAKESNKALEACASFFPDEVKRQTLKYNHSALNIIDIAKGLAGYEADDEQIREVMLQVLNEAWDKNSRCWKEPSIDLASAFKARENYGLWNLANLLREELQDEGHTIISLKGLKTDLVEQMADIKDELKAEEAALIAQAPTMPVEEAKKVINTLGVTKEQKLSAQKTLLQEELPEVNLTPQFVKKAVVDDRRRWLSQNKLFWYFTNTEALKQIDTEHWLSNLKKFAESMPFMRDIRSYSPKVKALEASGIFDFIPIEGEGIGDRIYQGDSPEAELFLKRCLKNKDLLQTAFNVLVTKKSSPIGLANRILGKVGLELEKVTKNKSDKRWQLSLKLVNDSDRLAVLKAFELRWQMSQEEAQKKEAQKQAQTHTEKSIQPQGQSPGYIDTDQGCPYPCAVESQGGNEPLPVVPAMPAETLNPVEEIVATLPYCQDAEGLRLNVADYSREVMEEAQKNKAQKQAQTHTEEAIQPQGQSPGYIDTDQGCPYPCAVESQGVATDSNPIAELIEAFPYCDTPQTFAAVVERYSDEVIEAAIALLPQLERSPLQQMWETLTDAQFLRSVTDWHEVTLSQTRLGAATLHLDATEQNRLVNLCQAAQQPVERQWGVTRQQAEMGGAFEWIRGGMVRVAYAAAEFVKLVSGDFVRYEELRVPG